MIKMKLKVYQYPNTPPDLYEQSGYIDSVPFTRQGIDRWCELVEPSEAQLFLAGQYHDKNSWMLEPARFEHLKGNEGKHYFDIEGDWAGKTIPLWLRPCMLSAMNAEPNHKNWNLLVRPGCSMLLKHLMGRKRAIFGSEGKIGFYFRGQRDPQGLRERVREALEVAKVPYEFEFTNQWNAVTDIDDPEVKLYLNGMERWSFALCPAGTGQMTVRLFEACDLGRVPIVIASNLLFAETNWHIGPHLSAHASVERMTTFFKDLCDRAEIESRVAKTESYDVHQFAAATRLYFHDPTLCYLAWMQRRGFLPGIEYWDELYMKVLPALLETFRI